MKKVILSFEAYSASKNSNESEAITETCQTCGEEECVCETEEITEEESAEEESVEEESVEEEATEEEATEEEATEEGGDEKVSETVAALTTKCYEYAVKESCDYDNDEYPDHTLESYLKENAALIAASACNTLELAHAELRGEEDLTIETYEGILNSMKESYSKKIDEMKDVFAAK
jgi:hypothetical protein